MVKTKKQILVLILVTFMLFIVMGCGKAEKQNNDDKSNSDMSNMDHSNMNMDSGK